MATIGVTGHRILSDQNLLQKSIDRALIRISERFGGEPMTLMTSLADGSDRLVAMQFLANGSRHIVAILPLKPEDYINDFGTDESRKEFSNLLHVASEIIQLPEFADRNEAYEAAGRYVVDHCDALICIWDGMPEQGQGGTGSMVERARKRGIPIVWIHAGNREPGTMTPTTLGADQGKIEFENW